MVDKAKKRFYVFLIELAPVFEGVAVIYEHEYLKSGDKDEQESDPRIGIGACACKRRICRRAG
jgi:hypothetical protein